MNNELDPNAPLNRALTGYQRFQLSKLWLKRGKEGSKETFIKAVCEQKGLRYVPPIEIKR